jgi:3-oxoacyl-[acyl-carrier protein] reductase
VDLAVAEFGSVDILVNNAGLTRDNLIHKMTDDDWNTVIDTHLKGSFYAVRAAQTHMVKKRFGKIVFISSRAALGNRGQTNYSAAKAGMQGMTRTLAMELGPFGINVNAIAPGHIDTGMTRATAERMQIDYSAMIDATIAMNSIKRVGVPDDIANVTSFLVSEDSSYMTGQILYVAGRPTI